MGDVILKWNDAIITDSEQLSELLSDAQPGVSVELTFRTRGQSISVMTTVTEDPRVEVVLMEDAGQEVTEEMLRFRSKWLSSKVK